MITLFCWVIGDENSFDVKISREQTVSELRSVIIAETPDSFSGIALGQIVLWRVEISDTKEALREFDFSNAIELRPTNKISNVFKVDPPEEYIHIVIKKPGELTERQLLMLRPPSLTYTPDNQRKKKSTTKSVWGRTPASVVDWGGFRNEVNTMALDDITPRYDNSTFESFEVSGEGEIQYALKTNVLRMLSKTIGSNQTPKEEFRDSTAIEKVRGAPDSILKVGSLLILAVEVKTKWTLSVDNIVEMYHDNLRNLAADRTSSASVIYPIKQIYGYMGHNRLRYGVLSTYERTWFLRRPEDIPDLVFISGVVKDTDTDPTLLQCFAYIMSLARRNSGSPYPPLPPSPPPPADDNGSPEDDDDDEKDPSYPKGPSSRSGRSGRGGNRGGVQERGGSSNTGKRNRSDTKGKKRAAGNELSKGVLLDDFGWDIDVIDVLGNGRSGTVFRAVLRGEEVAIKLCDLWQNPEYEKEMLTEVKTYMSLEKLQGRTIPKLKSARYTAGGLFAIATEIAGFPIELEELSDQERNEIVKALSDIHEHGVLHEDIHAGNILIQRHRDGFKATFIDFALSKSILNKEESKREMATLKKMLGICPTIGGGKFKKPRLA